MTVADPEAEPDPEADPDAEPQRYTGYLIRRAQQAHAAAWTRIVSTETSSVQYSIIVALARRGEASQRELCDAVDLDRSTIADLVRRMERRGLLSRRRSADDARRNTVVLTEQGRAEHAHLRPRVEQVEQELTGSLSADDRDRLREGLRQVLRAR
ncbi:MAG: winged helix-turn-helix transcriptional regulator [Actinobacteria bacterium]|nr:winged helix-turn-helix transcriptional regulator [Actinomycetota bacterium]